MEKLLKEAVREFLLENTPMDEIIEEYGMEVAQELGGFLTEAFEHLDMIYKINN